MRINDFEYDGKCLSDFGFVVCRFDDSGGAQTINAGSQITFNTVSRRSGKYFSLASTQYDECLTATFYICKNPCLYSDLEISNYEYRELVRWLNRHEYLKFCLLDDDATTDVCYYDASFNIQKYFIGGKLYGIELSMETNRPFGYGEEIVETLSVTNTSDTYTVIDESDEIGYIYPTLKITCNAAGKLVVENTTIGGSMTIANCSSGEIIEIDGETQIITTSSSSHSIADDFNFSFLKISNTYESRENNLKFSLPCTVELRYNPIIKDFM